MRQFITHLIMQFLVIFLILGCSNFDDKTKDYITRQCNFNDCDTCIIDLKNLISEDFDTIYVFDGYALPEGPSVIAEGDTDLVSQGGYIYGKEADKIVFVKNKKIVYQERWDHKYVWIESSGIFIQKEGIFDGTRGLIFEAEMYPTSRFKVTKSDKNSDVFHLFR